MIDQTTLKLYSPFEREVGKYRKQIHSQRDFENYLSYANGVEESYVSVYDMSFQIDRMLFDFDKDGFLQTAKKVQSWADENDFPVVPVVTGKKGIQLSILSKSFSVSDPRQTVSNIANYIIKQSLNIKTWNEAPCVDWTVCGNYRALSRIPNTLRPPENVSYASYLPATFVEMNESEVYSFSKSPHNFEYDMQPKRSFLELPFTSEWDFVGTSHSRSESVKFKNEFNPTDVVRFLEGIISHSLLSKVLVPNPQHRVRIRFALEMFDHGFSVQECVNILSKLHWHDYNESITRRYLEDLKVRFDRGEYHL